MDVLEPAMMQFEMPEATALEQGCKVEPHKCDFPGAGERNRGSDEALIAR